MFERMSMVTADLYSLQQQVRQDPREAANCAAQFLPSVRSMVYVCDCFQQVAVTAYAVWKPYGRVNGTERQPTKAGAEG